MNIYLGSDHNGFDYKNKIKDFLVSINYNVIDDGDNTLNIDDDFPQFAAKVANNLLIDNDSKGILICGSGQGMCMAANRFKGIRASLCLEPDEARAARNDDDSNILCLSARFTNLETAKTIINTWLLTPFANAPRFVRRIQQLDQLG